MASKTYFSEIDVIKGIAILTVVLEHSFAVKYVDLTGVQWCYHTVEIIKTFNMQLFFMVSGFLFANSKTDDLKRAYIGKVDRILIPMVFLTVINLVLVNALPSVINIEEETSVFQQIVNAVLYGESFWFLYTLFVLFCLLIPVKKYLTPKIVVAICLILVLLKELVDVKISFLQLNHVLYMGAFFLLGYLSYGYYEKVRVWVSKLYIVIPLLLIYAFLYPLNNIACIHNWILPLSLDIAVVGGQFYLLIGAQIKEY
jgi:fucose 4-O-acetylase-like acetyltransferase